MSRTSEGSQTALHTLMCVDLGLLLASFNLALLHIATPRVHRLIFGPKAWLSDLIGRVQGWDSHSAYHEPLGLWAQLSLVVGGTALLGMLAIRFLKPPYWGASRLGAMPAIAGVAVPWVVLTLCGRADGPGLGAWGAVIVGLGLIVAIGVSIGGVLLLESRLSHWAALGLVCTALLWQALVARYLDFYARPVAYASLVIAAIIPPIWLRWRRLER